MRMWCGDQPVKCVIYSSYKHLHISCSDHMYLKVVKSSSVSLVLWPDFGMAFLDGCCRGAGGVWSRTLNHDLSTSVADTGCLLERKGSEREMFFSLS